LGDQRDVDGLKGHRMGLPMLSPVLARCASVWISGQAEFLLQPHRPQTLFDYGFDVLDFFFGKVLGPV
jgi:hypothetical protein